MAGTNRDSQRVTACALGEVDNLFRLGVMRLLSHHVVFNACEHTKFSLNRHIVLVSVVHNLLGQFDILLIGKRGTIDHD